MCYTVGVTNTTTGQWRGDLRVEPYQSVILTGTHYQLVRTVDDRIEASGFTTAADAETWAAAEGYSLGAGS